MSDFKVISIKDIFVPERLRAVEEEHAIAIAQSIVEHGLINPITVRKTPAQKGGKFTMVAGAHRLRAFEINDEDEIEALVVEADATESQLIEITENLFRNDLSVIDRAVFVQSYRDVWEGKYGKIEPGRPGNRCNLPQLLADEAERGGFSNHVATRMGVSKDTVKRLNVIAQNLIPSLREHLRGRPEADNQSVLLKLAKEEPKRQQEIANGLSAGATMDQIRHALDGKKSKPDAQQVLGDRLMDTWRRSSKETRARLVREHLDEIAALVADLKGADA